MQQFQLLISTVIDETKYRIIEPRADSFLLEIKIAVGFSTADISHGAMIRKPRKLAKTLLNYKVFSFNKLIIEPRQLNH